MWSQMQPWVIKIVLPDHPSWFSVTGSAAVSFSLYGTHLEAVTSIKSSSVHSSGVVSFYCCCSVTKLCPALRPPWTAACEAPLSFTIFPSLLKLMSTESVIPSNHLILGHLLLHLLLFFPSIRVFSSKSVLCIRWLKYWSFSFSISPSSTQGWFPSELTGLISILSKGLLKSLLKHHNSKASILQSSAFFMVQLSHPYMTNGKITALTRWTLCWQGDVSTF